MAKAAALGEVPAKPPVVLENVMHLRAQERALVEQVNGARADLDAANSALTAHAMELANNPRGARPFSAMDDAGRLTAERDTAAAALSSAELALRIKRGELSRYADPERQAARADQFERFLGPARERHYAVIDEMQAAARRLVALMREAGQTYRDWGGELGHEGLGVLGASGGEGEMRRFLSEKIGREFFGEADVAALSYAAGNGIGREGQWRDERWRDRWAAVLEPALKNLESME